MKKVIALDIGGTNFRGALFDEKYHILKRNTLSTRKISKEDFINEAYEIIDELIDDEVISISIGVPGVVRNDGYTYRLPNVGLTNIDLVGALKKKYNLPVSVKNDAHVAVIGEANLGAGKDYKSTYFVTISTGLGGSLAIDHHFRLTSPEVGHETFLYNKKYYQYEGLCSGTGIVKLAKLHGLKITNAKELFDGVRNNEQKHVFVFKEWLKILKQFFRYINDLYQPEIFSITGGVLKSKDLFFDELKKSIKANIVECELKEDAGLFGSAYIGFHIDNESLM